MNKAQEFREIAAKAPSQIEKIIAACEESAKHGFMAHNFQDDSNFYWEYVKSGNQHVATAMARESGKKIINLLSEMGFKAEPFCISYGVQMAGVRVSWEASE